MNCYKCATPIPDNSRFCSACGADVSGDSTSPTLIAAPEPDLFQRLQSELGTEYILEKEIGRGGMAIVYGGRDAHLGRKVAVKVLPPELMYGGGSMVERFKREAQTAAKLDHPNIIPVFRVSPGGKLCWYVMKYLEGESLDHILEREGQLAVDRACDILSQTAAALDYAHQNQVVHRDVKPANIVIDKKGWVTVTDFGIAKALDANTLTASGSIIGTPYYMSPEQCKGKKVGPAADQYSLAVMAYQMLGGHVPFTGDSAVEIVHKHVADPVPPLGVLRPQLPPKVVEVVERALAKTAEDRFASVSDFATALKAAAEGVDITVAPPRKVAGVRISKTALVSPVPGAMRTAKGRARRRKGLLIGAVVVVLAGGGGAAALLLTRGGVPGPQPGAAPARGDQPSAATPGPTQEPLTVTPPAVAAAPSPEAPTGTEKRQPSAPTRSQRQAAQPPRQPVAQPAAPGAQPVQQQAAPAPAPAATGYVSVGGQFPGASVTILINGRAQERNPVMGLEVPAGLVRIRFVATIAATGRSWSQDTTCQVAAGETCNLRRITLRLAP
jgi:Protein kinase domain